MNKSELQPLYRTSLIFGSAGALINIVLLLFLYFLGRHPLLIPPFLDARLLIFLVFIYFAIREFKYNQNNGTLHFWQGMILGVLTYTIIGLLGSFFVYLFSSFYPEFLNRYISGALDGMEAMKEEMINGPQKVKLTLEEYNKQFKLLSDTSSGQIALDYFIKSMIMGFFIPLVYSIIFRKVNN